MNYRPAMQVHHHTTLPSTQDEAARLAANGAPDNTVVSADVQTAGRGRHNRTWVSPSGNLHLTLLLRPSAPIHRWPELSFVAALALAETLGRYLPDRIRLKWPNDVLAGTAKLAGILIEQAHEAALVGIGVNVAHAPDAPYPVTSLVAETAPARAPSPAQLREDLLPTFHRRRTQWESQGFDPIRTDWLGLAHPIGTRLLISETGQTGTFAGLDPSGALLLDTAEGRRRIFAGHVAMA